MRFLRRSSAGSMPISAAKRSMARSMAAEAAAHVGRDEVDLAGLEPERALEAVACLLGSLGRQPHGEALAVPRRRARPHLERGDGHPLVEDLLADDDLAPVEERRVERLAQ